MSAQLVAQSKPRDPVPQAQSARLCSSCADCAWRCSTVLGLPLDGVADQPDGWSAVSAACRQKRTVDQGISRAPDRSSSLIKFRMLHAGFPHINW